MKEDFSLTFEEEQIVLCAMEIAKYVDERHAVDIEVYDIVGLIKMTLGCFIDCKGDMDGVSDY